MTGSVDLGREHPQELALIETLEGGVIEHTGGVHDAA